MPGRIAKCFCSFMFHINSSSNHYVFYAKAKLKERQRQKAMLVEYPYVCNELSSPQEKYASSVADFFF
jgi:hypothetical protein